MWKIGIAIGLLGGIFGLGTAIYTAPEVGIPLSIFLVILFGFIWLKLLKPIFDTQRLLKTGTLASGRIIKVWDTGVTVNNNPQVGMEVEVNAVGRAPWVVKSRKVISRLQPTLFQPGAMVDVRYDPNDPSKVAVVGPAGSTSTLDPEDAETMLREVDRFNRDLNGRGDLAPAIIKEFIPLGINVNGDNPAAILKVKVMPSGDDPFDSEIKAVFGKEGLHKYQPGKEINVRYDRWAKERVTVDFKY